MKNLPMWVVKTLSKNGNVALPNICNDMDKEQLAKELSEAVGFQVVIRKASIRNGETMGFLTTKPYFIAEAKR